MVIPVSVIVSISIFPINVYITGNSLFSTFHLIPKTSVRLEGTFDWFVGLITILILAGLIGKIKAS
jgi:hypothetical protein